MSKHNIGNNLIKIKIVIMWGVVLFGLVDRCASYNDNSG